MTRALPLLALLAACAPAGPPAVAPGKVAADAEGRCWAGAEGTTQEGGTFEALCPGALTPDLVASLQRALAARGFYDGAVDGLAGPELNRAVRDFQRASGPDSPVLSLQAARDLGLVTLSPEEIARL